uniref:uncharacterized protein LOC131128724 isoform X5 n=1 Tax=Doryrhamphus excisus TaxID=161450 RepID=UPI0025AE63A8|nr:uncharacterized protein LOC131128724 isoform X5 [Doryrhamphus excisus]
MTDAMSFQTLRKLSVCWSVIPLFLHPLVTSSKKSGCFRVNTCKCIMKDGSGVINLQAMGDADGLLGRMKRVPADHLPANEDILMTFSPCQPFSQPEDLTGSDCTNVAACLIVRYLRFNRYIHRYINFGGHDGNDFHYNDTLKTLSVSYFVYVLHPGPDVEGRRAAAHLGGESVCLSQRLCHWRSGSRNYLPHHPNSQCRCVLRPRFLCSEAFSEQQRGSDLSGTQRVVHGLLPLH